MEERVRAGERGGEEGGRGLSPYIFIMDEAVNPFLVPYLLFAFTLLFSPSSPTILGMLSFYKINPLSHAYLIQLRTLSERKEVAGDGVTSR